MFQAVEGRGGRAAYNTAKRASIRAVHEAKSKAEKVAL